jgi:hypothetical protein
MGIWLLDKSQSAVSLAGFGKKLPEKKDKTSLMTFTFDIGFSDNNILIDLTLPI